MVAVVRVSFVSFLSGSNWILDERNSFLVRLFVFTFELLYFYFLFLSFWFFFFAFCFVFEFGSFQLSCSCLQGIITNQISVLYAILVIPIPGSNIFFTLMLFLLLPGFIMATFVSSVAVFYFCSIVQFDSVHSMDPALSPQRT
jgi:hypothetical protein